MRKLVCGLAFFMAVTSTFLPVAVLAQETEQQLSLYSDLYVDAGKRTDFETFYLDRNWRLAAANVSSGFVSAVSDQGVYRFLTNGSQIWRQSIPGRPRCAWLLRRVELCGHWARRLSD